jgi:hypothetical protein
MHLYDGVNYRVLRKFLLERGWPAGLQIKILSAKYGLIDATALIEPYDLRLNEDSARKMNAQVIRDLKGLQNPETVFVNLGKDYFPAVKGIEQAFPDARIRFAPGPIGRKMQAMKRWLERLPCGTVAIRGTPSKKRAYLYFFPDWDDFIYEPFSADDEESIKGKRTYAHQVCLGSVPFDGILLSLSHILVKKGALHHVTKDEDSKVSLRAHLKLPKKLLLFGDCGAFSYASAEEPPFTPEAAAKIYEEWSFDIGASVDHIPLLEIPVRDPDGTVRKQALSESDRRKRMLLTRDNAETFLRVCREKEYSFTPLGVIQGLDTQSYVDRLHEYLDMGYSHIAVGGLVPRSDDDILDIVCAVRRAVQLRSRECRDNVWLHLFGILRPKLQPLFKELGVSSFDSASYFRKAWLRSDQNYLDPSGRHWYGTIRVPISTSKPMQLAAASEGLSKKRLANMERKCLDAIEECNTGRDAAKEVTKAINKYGPLLDRKGEDNHFVEKHAALLSDRPWEKCNCPFCKSVGIHVVVFRGASRNKRRGLHNTWVFYHKVLHGKAIPTSSSEND